MTTRSPLALLLLALAPACGGEVLGDGLSEGEDRATESVKCAGHTLEGVDVSDAQGPIDWGAARRAGIDFMFAKATQGTYDTQSTFAHNWSHAKSAGVIRGAYHFFDPREDGSAQAHHFLSVVGKIADGDLPPMLDIECPDSDPRCLGFTGGSGREPASVIRARMEDFLSTVEKATGRKPIIYTFGSYFSGNGVSTAGLAQDPLFIAYPTSSGCFNVPAPWSAATFWQYSWQGRVPGIPSSVDRDRFLGTRTDLDAFTKEHAPSSGGSSGGGAHPAQCYSSTLARNVGEGTCVQSAHDARWYTCDQGNWIAGEHACSAHYAYCHSNTLDRDVPARTCVQARSDHEWYQCDDGWRQPVANGQGPAGACSSEYSL